MQITIKLIIYALPTKIVTPSIAFNKLEGAVLYWICCHFTNAVFSVFGAVLFSTLFWLTKPYPSICLTGRARF